MPPAPAAHKRSGFPRYETSCSLEISMPYSLGVHGCSRIILWSATGTGCQVQPSVRSSGDGGRWGSVLMARIPRPNNGTLGDGLTGAGTSSSDRALSRGQTASTRFQGTDRSADHHGASKDGCSIHHRSSAESRYMLRGREHPTNRGRQRWMNDFVSRGLRQN